jgi:hypothetical protein
VSVVSAEGGNYVYIRKHIIIIHIVSFFKGNRGIIPGR